MQSAQPAGGGMLASLGSTMASGRSFTDTSRIRILNIKMRRKLIPTIRSSAGMAFGAGSAVANQAVGAIFNSMSGGKESAPQAPAPAVPKAAGPCDTDRTSLNQCLSSSNASNCDFYFTALQNCQSNSV